MTSPFRFDGDVLEEVAQAIVDSTVPALEQWKGLELGAYGPSASPTAR